MNADRPHSRFIVVEGPIGVGKTSLAKRLAESFSGELVLEGTVENPFLEQFYRSGRKTALPAQLFFLFQRTRQLESLRQSDMFAPIRIADFHVLKDRLFAELNLSQDEMKLYEQIYDKLDVEVPRPDLVIYLQASVDALMSRIARRGIEYERMIDRAYLEKVADTYARYFYNYDDSPLLIVNASAIDPVRNDADYDALFDQVRRTTGGRHFFNPAAAVAFA
ncbi:MAG: deoxynucleoside kinase [Proteobacteria bacterium]|nr:deoxynucleoside kinase [Pseudomonadota bacterium]MDA0992881.1 deoxynucleoside kinase [Pseudomonadota bacterium]